MFNIRDFIEFNAKGRADCPVCTLDKGAGGLTLSIKERPINPESKETEPPPPYFQCFRGCTYKQIMDAVGYKPERKVTKTQYKAAKASTGKRYTDTEITEGIATLLRLDSEARKWLEARGISSEIAQWARLTETGYRSAGKRTRAIGIPYPTGIPGEFYLKKRIAPWDDLLKQNPKYVPWSQKGIPATVLLTHNPAKAEETWICEGEWDAILLGWAVKQTGDEIAVACFSCGCSTVPPKAQLDLLPGQIKIFYDRNDKPNRAGKIPGDEGALKLAKALGGRGAIAAVPMPDDCQVKGWDVSDALNLGYSVQVFKDAARKARIPQDISNNKLEQRGKWNRDLIAHAPDYIPFLVPDLLTEDELFLLAAGPRAGKSLMAMSLAKAVAEGGFFLGRPCTQGTSIYVKCEDSDAKIKERQIKQGWDKDLPVFWLDEFKLSELESLIDLIERLDPRLIVLDTLSRVKTHGISESSAEMSQILEPLQVVAKRYGVCILLVHHTSKISIDNASQVDIFETIRGSSAIRAVCRGAFVLAANDREYRLVCENGWGRYDLKVVLDANTLTWRELGTWYRESDIPQKTVIIEALRKIGPASIQELHRETGIFPNSLYKQLDRLIAAPNANEKVLKTGAKRRYKYQLALLDTIGQLNMLSNSENVESERDTGYYWTDPGSAKGEEIHRPVSHPIGQNPAMAPSGSTHPGKLSNRSNLNNTGEGVEPIGQLFDTIGQGPSIDHQSKMEITQPCDSYMATQKTTDPSNATGTEVLPMNDITLTVGDICEVKEGRFTGKRVQVLEVDLGGEVCVQAPSWAIARTYPPSDLRFIRRPEEKVSESGLSELAE